MGRTTGGIVHSLHPGAAKAARLPYYLTERETRRHGVDIGSALQLGLLEPDDLEAILAACRACRKGQQLRAAPGHDRRAAATPDWCANRDILEGLRGLT